MNKKLLIIIIIAVVLIGAGVGAYFLFFSGEPAEEEPVVLYPYTPGDYFVTNVKGGNHLLKATIVLMLDEEKLVEELKKNEFVIRDTIIYHLRQLDDETLRDAGIQDKLRTELADALNKVLGIENIKTIYFNDLVMQ